MCASLEASNGHSTTPSKRYLSMDNDALAEAIKTLPLITESTPQKEMNDIIASLYRQFEELHSATSKPFSVIVHGDVRPENVTFTQSDVPGELLSFIYQVTWTILFRHWIINYSNEEFPKITTLVVNRT